MGYTQRASKQPQEIKIIYLASPYSSPLPTVVEERFVKTVNFTMILLKDGFPVFSPIAYFHPFAQMGQLPTDAGYWHNFNMQFLRKAEAIFVLRLIGWDQSKGVQIETGIAKQLNIPRVDFSADFQRIQ